MRLWDFLYVGGHQEGQEPHAQVFRCGCVWVCYSDECSYCQPCSFSLPFPFLRFHSNCLVSQCFLDAGWRDPVFVPGLYRKAFLLQASVVTTKEQETIFVWISFCRGIIMLFNFAQMSNGTRLQGFSAFALASVSLYFC